MKCIVDGCVNDARFNSSYCEECWECIVADAKASFYCAEPGFYDYDDNPGEGDNDGALASIYREVQAIKEMACDEIMRGKIERRRLERENVTLRNTILRLDEELRSKPAPAPYGQIPIFVQPVFVQPPATVPSIAPGTAPYAPYTTISW